MQAAVLEPAYNEILSELLGGQEKTVKYKDMMEVTEAKIEEIQ